MESLAPELVKLILEHFGAVFGSLIIFYLVPWGLLSYIWLTLRKDARGSLGKAQGDLEQTQRELLKMSDLRRQDAVDQVQQLSNIVDFLKKESK